jgi:Arc/MetJ-type ribon-helix-helix transcriptional regulator
MWAMGKVHATVPDELKQAAELQVSETGYKDLSEFIRESLRDNVDREYIERVNDK